MSGWVGRIKIVCSVFLSGVLGYWSLWFGVNCLSAEHLFWATRLNLATVCDRARIAHHYLCILYSTSS